MIKKTENKKLKELLLKYTNNNGSKANEIVESLTDKDLKDIIKLVQSVELKSDYIN